MQLYNIGYLEDFDFKGKTLIPSEKEPGKVYLVGIVSSHCGHCVKAKPAFQAFAENNKNSNVVVCCIATDETKDSVKKLSSNLKDHIENFGGGIPFFCVYKGGKQKDVLSGERTEEGFSKLVKKYL